MLWGSLVETQPNLYRATVTNVGLNEPTGGDKIKGYTIRANGNIRALIILSHLLGGVFFSKFRKMWSYDHTTWALGFNMEPKVRQTEGEDEQCASPIFEVSRRAC